MTQPGCLTAEEYCIRIFMSVKFINKNSDLMCLEIVPTYEVRRNSVTMTSYSMWTLDAGYEVVCQ